ncbi:MAG: hypothetical protein RR365_00760 [Bacteroides sp.]
MDFNDILTVIFKVVIIPVLPVAAAYLIAYLRTKKEELTNSMNNQVVASVLSEAGDAVLQAVEYVSQTYVDNLKTQGKFDVEAQKQAFEKAKEAALTILTEESLELLTSITGDVETWLTTKIEQTVREKKYTVLQAAEILQDGADAEEQ